MTTTLLAEPTSVLLDKFGAGQASPGSGSAAALMGILAIKLLLTVCIKTKEKSHKRKEIDRVDFIIERLRESEQELRLLFEKDARDFAKVIELRIKRDRARTKVEQTLAARQANDELEAGTELVFQIAGECLTIVDFGVSLFKEGWPAVRGDAGAAVSAAISGAMSCVFVASLNAKALRGRSFAPKCLDRCRDLTAEIQVRQASALDCVALLSAEALDAIQLRIT